MTYCLGIKIPEGLVALSDGRLTTGAELSSARKVTVLGKNGDRFFIMNSGLRGVRDKALAYLKRDMTRRHGEAFATMLEAVTAFAACLRRVAAEDKETLEKAGLAFNLHTIIGGQLAEDHEPALYLVYPEANWIEVDERAMFVAIGATSYGKAILDRTLTPATDISTAMKVAFVSFDSIRLSSAEVGFPLDMLCYRSAERSWRQARFEQVDLLAARQWWDHAVTEAARRMPDDPWVQGLRPVE